MKPETVIRRHRKGLRLYRRTVSKRGPGRPPISEEVQALIRRLACENGWRARKLQAELEKLGFAVSLAAVSRYLPKREFDGGQRQHWMTFLRNHKDCLTTMRFFAVPTVRFRLLYASGGRPRRSVHFSAAEYQTEAPDGF